MLCNGTKLCLNSIVGAAVDVNPKTIAIHSFLPEDSYDTAAAEREEELLDIAAQYAVEIRGHRDTPALREELRSMLRQQRKRHVA